MGQNCARYLTALGAIHPMNEMPGEVVSSLS